MKKTTRTLHNEAEDKKREMVRPLDATKLFAHRVSDKLLKSSFTVQDIAERIHYSPATIFRIRDHGSIPNMDFAIRYACLEGMDVCDFLVGLSEYAHTDQPEDSESARTADFLYNAQVLVRRVPPEMRQLFLAWLTATVDATTDFAKSH